MIMHEGGRVAAKVQGFLGSAVLHMKAHYEVGMERGAGDCTTFCGPHNSK